MEVSPFFRPGSGSISERPPYDCAPAEFTLGTGRTYSSTARAMRVKLIIRETLFFGCPFSTGAFSYAMQINRRTMKAIAWCVIVLLPFIDGCAARPIGVERV